ncbi:hypothetical protein DFJ74DRAFT_659630 [Hyaloraphidium curvatum]|nr:hypothetical protein DFJ74DRAFT_659630 [Hyaloraphidium curvatum]
MASVGPSTGLAAMAEMRIRTAQRQGAFDELEGHGRPIDLPSSPFVDSHEAILNRIMIRNGVSPEWIQSGQAIEKDALELKTWMRKEWIKRKRYPDVLEGPWRQDLDRRAEALNLRIRHYNLIVPASFLERAPFVLETELKEMLEDLPPLSRPVKKEIVCW